MRLGIDRLLTDPELQRELSGKRLSLLGHAASVTSKLEHSLDALVTAQSLRVSSAFGPQHGMRGEKQYNMIESDDYVDPIHKIPVFSLYGKVRRPTAAMMDSFDVMLVDLQDVGCRIYTYLTTLHYVLEACAQHKKAIWVLDRPNPAGRVIEGSLLKRGWESFVGSSSIVMRHGLTLGELARWLVAEFKLDVELKVIPVEGYDPNASPGYGWPLSQLAWVNPSPNMPTLSAVRSYSGTVIFEGTNLSEGRGTTRPLEIIGAPGLEAEKILKEMERFEAHWMRGCHYRACYFEPTFDKFKGELCSGVQLHADDAGYRHEEYRPYRWALSFCKATQKVQPEAFRWREPPYEYEATKLPIDIINGGDQLRLWVDDPASSSADLEKILMPDEREWRAKRTPFLIYKDG
ncbi:MAG: DUF1343 domain-containing protein [Bdellovibrionales bacterium]|nr:DUF1343 domain-containing protein [Bdellovibrionales bacterium]